MAEQEAQWAYMSGALPVEDDMEVDSPRYVTEVDEINWEAERRRLAPFDTSEKKQSPAARQTAVPGAFVFDSPVERSPRTPAVQWREREAHIVARAASRNNSSSQGLSPAGRMAKRTLQEGGNLRSGERPTKRQHASASHRGDDSPAGRAIPMQRIGLVAWLRNAASEVVGSLFRLFGRRAHGEQAQIIAVPTSSGKRRCVLQADRETVLGTQLEEDGHAAPDASPKEITREQRLANLAIELQNQQAHIDAVLEELKVNIKDRVKKNVAGKSGNLQGLRTPINKYRRGRKVHYTRDVAKDFSRAASRGLTAPRQQLRFAIPPFLPSLIEDVEGEATPPSTRERERQLWSEQGRQIDAQYQAERAALLKAKQNQHDASPTSSTSQAFEELDTPTRASNHAAAANLRSMTAVGEHVASSQDAPQRAPPTPGRFIGRWTIGVIASKTNDDVLKDQNIDLLTKKARALVLQNGEQALLHKQIKEDFDRLKHARLSRHKDELDRAQANIDEALARNERLRSEALLKKQRIQQEAAEKKAAQEKAEAEAKERALALLCAAEQARAEERERAEEAERLAAQQIFRNGELIVEPSIAMNEALDTKMAARTQAAVVATTVTNTTLERDDMARVLGKAIGARAPAWLNDVSVNAWLQVLCAAMNEKQGWTKSRDAPTPPFAAYSSAWYKQLHDRGAASLKRWTSRLGIKEGRLDQTDFTFLPVNTGAHWVLAIIQGKSRKIEYLDSFDGRGNTIIAAVRSLLEAELGSAYNANEWSVARSRSSIQSNTDDCGVFTCFNAFAAARGVPYRDVTAAKMPAARRLMAAVLMNGGFTGDAQL